MTGRRRPAYFIGGGPLAGHSFVETEPDAQPLPRTATYGIYQLSDDSADDSLIYESPAKRPSDAPCN